MNRLDALIDDVLNLPLHRACGLQVHTAVGGASEIEIAINDFTRNPAGVLHGGMLYTFFDVGCFLAVLSLLEAHRHPVTIESHTSVVRSAGPGDRVLLRARVDRLGRTLASIRAEAYAVKEDGEERLIGTGSVTKSILEDRDR